MSEDNLVDGDTESGNFHMKAKQHEEYENAITEGHFSVLTRRIVKVSDTLDDIVSMQDFEREQEALYRDYQNSLYNNFWNLTALEILMVLGSSVYSIISLRKFFVKKSLF